MLDGAGSERVECFDAGVEFFVGDLGFEYRVAPGNIVGAVVDQPVAHCHGGADVVFVVARDPVEAGLVEVAHPVLVLDDGACALVDVVGAFVVGERLDVFETVRLGAHLECAGDDREQVDKQAGVNEAFEWSFRDAVVGGESDE